MSENKNDLRKLVKIIVFILAFFVSGIASLGVLSLLMGITTTGIGLVMDGVTSSVGIVGDIASLIPKLFAPSAKSKASELTPAVGTWLKLQQAYIYEHGEVGNCSEIGYTLPGDGRTSNFEYSCGIKNNFAYLFAESNEALDDCPAGSGWYILITNGDYNIEAHLPENINCQKLTPNFSKLGEKEKKDLEKLAAENTAKKAAEEEAQRKAAEEAAKLAAEEAAKKAEEEAQRKAEEEAEAIMKGLGDF